MSHTEFYTITNCIICNRELTMLQLQKQRLYEKQTVQLITCTNNCRVKYYKRRKEGLI